MRWGTENTLYQVIARTWRPQKFSEVIGQRHVTQTLQNAIRLNRIGHGYIFSGQRGVGKTTVARLLAKALNCHRGPTPEPCGECDSCREIASGRAVDVIEIDAASNRGIDSIRELRENARYAPARDRYKVFIIDEAHQITNEGFNALLKILEEPPPHVVFLLATTEVHQFPETILSRCQHFSLHALTFPEILAYLETVCAGEKVAADPETLALLAKSGEGSLRDALSRLDQVIAAFGSKLEGEAVRRFLGEAPSSLLEEVLTAAKNRQREPMLQVVEKLVEGGYQLTHFCSQLIRTVRNLLVIRVAGSEGRLVEASPEETQRLTALAEGFTEESLMRCLDILLRLNQELRYSMDPRFQMELGLLKLVDAEKLVAIEDVLAQMESGAGPKPQSNIQPTPQQTRTPQSPSGTFAPSPSPSPAPRPAKLTPWEQDSLRKKQSRDPSASDSASVGDVYGTPSEVTGGSIATVADEAPAQPTESDASSSSQQEAWIREILRQLEEQEKRMLASILSMANSWQFSDAEVRIQLTGEGMLNVIQDADRLFLEGLCTSVVGRRLKVVLSDNGGASQQPRARGTGAENKRPAAGAQAASSADSRIRQDPEVQEFEKLFGKSVTVTRDWRK